jgi:hypothetical protein
MNATARALDFSDMDDLDTCATKQSRPRGDIVTIECPDCHGRKGKMYGYVNLRWYECKMCLGKGVVSQDRANRVKGARKGMKTAAENLRKRQLEFQKEHPKVWDHLGKQMERGTTSEFVRSLYEQLMNKGYLSEKQIAAVERGIEKAAENRVAREANRPEVGQGAMKMLDVFKTARGNGFKRPVVRTEHFDFSLAPDAGANSGFIYVKSHDTKDYLGKISPEGKFIGYKTPEATLTLLMEVCENPLDAAVKFGMKSGTCSCCGRELTNKESVELGIGPICRERFFGG